MKDLEWQVSNKDLSKKLKELKVKQESLWYWIDNKLEKESIPEIEWDCGPGLMNFNADCRNDCSRCKQGEKIKHKVYSAFTVAELGEMLPLDCKTVRDEHVECGVVYFCEFRNKHFIDNTEANARAKMLIHLIEKGITWKT